MTQNVVAVWEGSDPVLKNEYVAMGAHYDHVGICAPGTADPICNGADDDGSGTTALLGMAEALSRAKQRPKRSVLFVWHCGEEKGLWGSRYFTDYPTIPLDQIVTQLNIDMIGRSKKDGDTNPRNKDLSGPDAIYVIGSTMMSTDLGALSQTGEQIVSEPALRLSVRRSERSESVLLSAAITTTTRAKAFRSSSSLTACTRTITVRATSRKRSITTRWRRSRARSTCCFGKSPASRNVRRLISLCRHS